jgi:RNA polymerase sigma-70 factor (ECF subfamily)
MAAVAAEVRVLRAPREQEAERGAFVAKLFERHSLPLLWYLIRLTPSREDAEEVVQEAYLRLLNTPNLEADDARARSYLFRTAKNLAFDLFRRRKARCEHLHVDIDSLDVGSDEPCPDDWADWDSSLKVFRGALHDLMPRSREAFLLHCNERMTYQHIADRLGVSKKTIERDISMVQRVCRSRLAMSRSGEF